MKTYTKMKEQDKQLLLVDLCARLPYGVYVNIEGVVQPQRLHWSYLSNEESWDLPKPYLRPMSSITLEELEECRRFGDYVRDAECKIHIANYKQIDWLNAHHFDYRTDDKGKTMIEKGVALKAPERMYN